MRINKELYTNHIKDNDKNLEMRKLLDKIESVLNNYCVESTDFLDPYDRYLAKSILTRFNDIKFLEFGGTINSERKIFLICPDYYDDSNLDFKLSYLRITGDIEGLSHKDFLGGLLSLGLKRNKIGDIFVHSDFVDIVVRDEINNFILFNLEKIGSKKIKISKLDQEELKDPIINFKEINKFVTSLRLDVILSSVYNLSRQESINIIKSGNVKINWELIVKPSRELNQGDTISTRGYGRLILNSIDGISKKGRLHVTVRILI